jgi:fatty-acyl-CoA synthase
MMNYPLTLRMMLERAEKFFAKKEIVSRTQTGISRFTYAEYGKRTRRLSSALQKLGIVRGERVGTIAWNHHRHLEAYFAVPCMGAVLHTINFRLSPEHLAYIINHAEDRVLLIDEDMVPVVERVKDELKTVRAYIILSDSETLPETELSPVYSYEALLKDGDETFSYPLDIDEYAPAGMCYTSATTGNPKGVVYTHRGLVLHSFAAGLADTLAVSERDTVLPIVPMFHANAWGLPFAATWFGAKQVLPGPQPTPQILLQLIEKEKVTFTAGVPTVWLGVLQELEKNRYDVSSLRAVVCGGSAAPKAMIKTFEQKYHIPFIHAYGMTETTPIATVANLKSTQLALSQEERYDIRAKQGLLVPGLEMRVVGANGDVAWNGQEMGELWLRGPWIAKEYYNDERSKETFVDGWLRTGDVACVDEEGFIKLIDRTKDLIKSGGEWISSVDLENALMAHEAVLEAAVVAVPHEKWLERPVACVVLKEAYKGKVSKEDLIQFIAPQFAKWWLPDDVVFMDAIPRTSVGKFLKRALREQLKNHLIS